MIRPPLTQRGSRSIAAIARLSETQRMLGNLQDRGFTDEQIARSLGADPAAVAHWRAMTERTHDLR
jgi:hypothetical protein